jgi:hypothetical protein
MILTNWEDFDECKRLRDILKWLGYTANTEPDDGQCGRNM